MTWKPSDDHDREISRWMQAKGREVTLPTTTFAANCLLGGTTLPWRNVEDWEGK
jgi:hypothetical protein